MPDARAMPAAPPVLRLLPRSTRPRPAAADAPILLSPPQLTGQELASLAETLQSGWIAPAGPVPAAFEAALAEASGFAHVLATASGTAALHLGYRVLGLGAGRRGLGADPHLRRHRRARRADGREGHLPRRLAGELDARPRPAARTLARAARAGRLPRVVVPVDLYGQCADLDAIVAACDRWGVPVLCDSAEAWARRRAARAGRAAARGSPASPSTATRSSPPAAAAPWSPTTRR